jgi:hypothetical protein
VFAGVLDHGHLESGHRRHHRNHCRRHRAEPVDDRGYDSRDGGGTGLDQRL